MITVKANAKINLSLEVMETDTKNYHLVNTIMAPISIYDEITVEECEKTYIVNDKIDENIVLKAAHLFLEYFNIKSGVKITLKKNIPMAAGLAGGSTDAAFTLKALNELFKTKAKEEELELLCRKLGSDVAFFIKDKLAMCSHYGEIVTTYDFDYEKIKILLIKPNVGLSTKEVYKNYDYVRVSRTQNTEGIIKGLKENNIDLINKNFFNDLNKISLKLCPELNKIYTKIKQCYDVKISGSGPTMFILNPNDKCIEEISNKYKDICYIEICHLL